MSNETVLDLADIAAILNVNKTTISQYLSDSRQGRRYAENPFPAPDRRIGKSPVWLPHRQSEIEQWADSRPGRGYHRP